MLLRADVLLLSRVHDVSLLQDFHGKRFCLFTFELHQFDSSESSDPQSVDDVEVCELQAGEESVFGFISGALDDVEEGKLLGGMYGIGDDGGRRRGQ